MITPPPPTVGRQADSCRHHHHPVRHPRPALVHRPHSNGEGIHTGDDWNLPGGTPIGTPVYAVADGTVTIADAALLD